ncbi:NAD-dependent epimerase/dehydratase family protein [Bordetella muralis]|uniref:NAD-dependent epimerase/dehydratase family protein n=1 Tax=Bordetella muralis TaxID=1649130 RepID=UPI0039F018CC
MKILLTGSTGMVGRNLLEHPKAAKFQWLTPSHAELDLAMFSAVSDYIGSKRPDAIVHAAGKVGGIHANIREPVRFLIDNLDMGRNVLLAAQQHSVSRLINLASSCIYPRNRQNALVEEEVLTGELEPTNEGYALAKIAVARLADYISRERPELCYRSLIPCNLYGRYDNFDPIRSHLIPAIIHKTHQAKMQGIGEIEIWGDGCARREFLYAQDLAGAVLAAVEDTRNLPNMLNIGLGVDYTINEYYEVAAEVIGFTGSFKHDLTKPVGMSKKLTSIEKARNWGWSPTTTLKAGLEATYEFYLSELRKK